MLWMGRVPAYAFLRSPLCWICLCKGVSLQTLSETLVTQHSTVEYREHSTEYTVQSYSGEAGREACAFTIKRTRQAESIRAEARTLKVNSKIGMRNKRAKSESKETRRRRKPPSMEAQQSACLLTIQQPKLIITITNALMGRLVTCDAWCVTGSLGLGRL